MSMKTTSCGCTCASLSPWRQSIARKPRNLAARGNRWDYAPLGVPLILRKMRNGGSADVPSPMSSPQLSSKVIPMAMLTDRSRAGLIFVRPPSLLIFKFTTSIARSARARSRMPRSSVLNSPQGGNWRATVHATVFTLFKLQTFNKVPLVSNAPDEH